jgi:hypothetical protein
MTLTANCVYRLLVVQILTTLSRSNLEVSSEASAAQKFERESITAVGQL